MAGKGFDNRNVLTSEAGIKNWMSDVDWRRVVTVDGTGIKAVSISRSSSNQSSDGNDGRLKLKITIKNKDQSNLAKGGIAPRFYSPGGSSNSELHVLGRGPTPNLFPRWWSGTPSYTLCQLDPANVPAKCHLNPPNGLSTASSRR